MDPPTLPLPDLALPLATPFACLGAMKVDKPRSRVVAPVRLPVKEGPALRHEARGVEPIVRTLITWAIEPKVQPASNRGVRECEVDELLRGCISVSAEAASGSIALGSRVLLFDLLPLLTVPKPAAPPRPFSLSLVHAHTPSTTFSTFVTWYVRRIHITFISMTPALPYLTA